jgi:CDP-glucose 4,6-dehydratase
MANMVIQNLFDSIYKNKRILITGHTGFKGSWLSLWLKELGADVTGYSLEPQTKPNHFELLKQDIISIIADIREKEKVEKAILEVKPDIVFHLAAQAIISDSYNDPVGTFKTNIMGTINVLEACKKIKSVKAVVIITSDKCYDNKESSRGYKETDPVGGYDPYSASKGCTEIATSSYRSSFFNLNNYGITHNTLIASCRAGNIIGGGDWGKDRLIPDIMRSIQNKEEVIIRSPNSTRPWQHILEPLRGYLMLGQKLLEGKKEFAEAWNFGPLIENYITVEQVIKDIEKEYGKFIYRITKRTDMFHETNCLKLDSSKAYCKLGWKPILNYHLSMKKTIEWYKEYFENKKIISCNQLEDYCKGLK